MSISFLNFSPLDPITKLAYQSCECFMIFRMPMQYIDSILDNWQEAMDRVCDISSSEKFIENCKSVFHPNHFIPFGVKFNLCQVYKLY